MKHTESQILEKAKQVMADIDGKYYSEEKILNAFFREKDKSVNAENPIDTWTVSIRSLFDNTDFLVISDETCKPIYYQNFNTYIGYIEKNAAGKYVMKSVL